MTDIIEAIEAIQGLADLLEEIIFRDSKDYNDWISLILTGEQLREQLSAVESSPGTLRAEVDIEFYEYVLCTAPGSFYWPFRGDLEEFVPKSEDDEYEKRYCERAFEVIKRHRIEKAVDMLTNPN